MVFSLENLCRIKRNPRKGGPSGLAFGILLSSSLGRKYLQVCISTSSLVQVLCCQSISNTKDTKHGMRGHFRYNLPLVGDL